MIIYEGGELGVNVLCLDVYNDKNKGYLLSFENIIYVSYMQESNRNDQVGMRK